MNFVVFSPLYLDKVNKDLFRFCLMVIVITLTLKLPGGWGPNGPTFRNIGLWFTDEEKNVVFGMHVNLVYKNYDA